MMLVAMAGPGAGIGKPIQDGVHLVLTPPCDPSKFEGVGKRAGANGPMNCRRIDRPRAADLDAKGFHVE